MLLIGYLWVSPVTPIGLFLAFAAVLSGAALNS
jgi:hypothetical protein